MKSRSFLPNTKIRFIKVVFYTPCRVETIPYYIQKNKSRLFYAAFILVFYFMYKSLFQMFGFGHGVYVENGFKSFFVHKVLS